jgi:lipopolysaccharide cholinephosphotransferase
MFNLSAENICDFYVTNEQKKIWLVELDLLRNLLDVCEKYNLKCFVAHGTLLGAVRHEGFIPWDDDIDVNMPRDDYERLKKIAPTVFKDPYFLQTEYNDRWFNGFSKLRNKNTTGMDLFDVGHGCCNGIFIDIFPMDGVFENKNIRRIQSYFIEFFRRLCVANVYYDIPKLWVKPFNKGKSYKIISKFFSRKFLCDCFIKACKMCDYSKSIRTGIHAFITEYECCYWYREDFEELDILRFENLLVPAPKNWDRCLSIKWNNYMDLPPVEKRKIRHHTIVFSADIPYKEYDISTFFCIFEELGDKKICLFGAGELAKSFLREYNGKAKPFAIFDNNKESGTYFCDIPVYNAKEILSHVNEKSRIVICSTYFNDIINQLKSLNLTDFKVYSKYYSNRRPKI